MPIKKETKYHAWYWIAVIAAMMVIQAVFASFTQIQTIPYSEFQDDLKAGKIAEVRVSGNYIQGKFKEPDPKGYSEFITTRVDATTAEELVEIQRQIRRCDREHLAARSVVVADPGRAVFRRLVVHVPPFRGRRRSRWADVDRPQQG